MAEQLRFVPVYEVEEPYAAVFVLLPQPIDPVDAVRELREGEEYGEAR